MNQSLTDKRVTRLLEVTLPARLRFPLLRRARSLIYRGKAVECPCCSRSFSQFADDWNRPQARCPRCGSHERHRTLALYLREHKNLIPDNADVLHFAPEGWFQQRFSSERKGRYVTTDLDDPAVDINTDITALELPDNSFDVAICLHVFEHVESDITAFGELFRVLRPGGRLIAMVPQDMSREATYEDPTITEPAQRQQAFWQEDHVRLYGRDFPNRLQSVGFTVTSTQPDAAREPAGRHRYGLLQSDLIHIATHPNS